jgi:amino acid transporter
MLIAPRIYSEMARDGVLPESFASKEGKLPLAATILQASIAIVLIHTHSILEAIESSSSVLMIFTSLAVGGLFLLYKRKTTARPSRVALVCAAVYIILVMWVLWQGLSLSGSYKTLILFGLILLAAIISTITRSIRRRGGSDFPSIVSGK